MMTYFRILSFFFFFIARDTDTPYTVLISLRVRRGREARDRRSFRKEKRKTTTSFLPSRRPVETAVYDVRAVFGTSTVRGDKSRTIVVNRCRCENRVRAHTTKRIASGRGLPARPHLAGSSAEGARRQMPSSSPPLRRQPSLIESIVTPKRGPRDPGVYRDGRSRIVKQPRSDVLWTSQSESTRVVFFGNQFDVFENYRVSDNRPETKTRLLLRVRVNIVKRDSIWAFVQTDNS